MVGEVVGDTDGLRHVARLSDTLTPEERNQWIESIKQVLSKYKSPLKKQLGLRDLAFHLWKALPDGPEK